MTEMQPESVVIRYLNHVGTMEASSEDAEALLARLPAAPRPRRRRGRAWARRPILAAVIAGAVSAGGVATAAGLIPLDELVRSTPPPPAATAAAKTPTDVLAAIGVLRRDAEPRDRAPAAAEALERAGDRYVFDPRSIRAAGSTPLGESVHVAYVRTNPAFPLDPREQPEQGVYVAVEGRLGGVGEAGPFSLRSIEAGTALMSFGVSAPGSGSFITGVVPDGVTAVRLEHGARSRTVPVRDNLVLAALPIEDAKAFPDSAAWIGAGDSVVKRIDF